MKKTILIFLSAVVAHQMHSQSCFDAGNGSDGAFDASSNTTLAGGVYNFTSFSIAPGVTVTGSGTEPLFIKVTGNATIEGTLSVQGGHGANGVNNITYGGGGIGVAGGANGGNGSYGILSDGVYGVWGGGIGGGAGGYDYSGGGGGGYATEGNTASIGVGGSGGIAYGNAELNPFYAGSGGGGGSGGFYSGGGGGGAGGGAIEFHCGGLFTLASGGVIIANGGNGGAAGDYVGGGGGGSGGAILIKADAILNDGLITATGGTGGTTLSWLDGRAGADGAPGRIRIDHNSPITGTGTTNPAIGSEQALLEQPTISAMVSPAATVCAGTSIILTGEGDASSYSWSDDVTDGQGFIPSTSQWYVVTGSVGTECYTMDSVYIDVLPNPETEAVAFPGPDICEGNSLTLTGSGNATSYTWSDGVQDGVAFVPTSSGPYTVTGSDGVLCSASTTIFITVNSLPIVDLGPDVETTSSSVTLDAGAGFSTYLWNTSASTQTIDVSESGTYSVLVTNAEGCADEDEVEVSFITGIDDAMASGFSIYPNPATDYVTLTTNKTPQSIRIFGIAGNLMKVLDKTEKVIPVSDLAKGNYFLEILSDDVTCRLLLIRQ